jgi:hypothetical protein
VANLLTRVQDDTFPHMLVRVRYQRNAGRQSTKENRQLKPSRLVIGGMYRIMNTQRVLAPLSDGLSTIGFSLLYNHKKIFLWFLYVYSLII